MHAKSHSLCCISGTSTGTNGCLRSPPRCKKIGKRIGKRIEVCASPSNDHARQRTPCPLENLGARSGCSRLPDSRASGPDQTR